MIMKIQMKIIKQICKKEEKEVETIKDRKNKFKHEKGEKWERIRIILESFLKL